MHKQPKQLHQPNSRLNLIALILIHPHNSIAPGHNNLPNNLLGNILRGKESILRDSGRTTPLLELDKLASPHPQVIDMPALEDIPEILPK